MAPDAEGLVSTSQQTNTDTSMWAFATTALPLMQVLDVIGAQMWTLFTYRLLHGTSQKNV